MSKACSHPKGDAAWYPHTKDGRVVINEDGWRCISCQEPLGFRPDLDTEMIELKVQGIIFDLHEGNWLRMSNGTEGQIVGANVAGRCREADRYD